MTHIFPPTIGEWHATVVGFWGGFVWGSTEDDAVAKALVRRVVESRDHTGHLSDAEDEAAYTAVAFLAGSVAGRWWSRRNA